MNVESENHKTNTIVELYFEKELSDITFESKSLDEWKEIARDLGMNNQLDLAKGKESPIPFPYMNISMMRVYETLCPEKRSYKEYNKSAIPLEVMKQIAFCIRENHFNEIQVWYDDKTPDPVIVGKTHKWCTYLKDENGQENIRAVFNTKEECLAANPTRSPYTTEENNYLIAKWGDVKRSFQELKGLAKERFIEKHANKMKMEIETLQGKLNRITENASLFLIGELTESQATTTSTW